MNRWIILVLVTLIAACGGGGGGSGSGAQPAEFVETIFSPDGCLIDSNEDASYSLSRGGVSITHKIWGYVEFEGDQGRRVDAVYEGEAECPKEVARTAVIGALSQKPIPAPADQGARAEIHVLPSAEGPLLVTYSGGQYFLEVAASVINKGSLPLYGMRVALSFDGEILITDQQPSGSVAKPQNIGIDVVAGDRWVWESDDYRGFSFSPDSVVQGEAYPVAIVVIDAYGEELVRHEMTAVANW